MIELPVLDAEGRPLDQVRLVGLRARGHHGVFEHERRDGQDFCLDVVLHLDTRAAAASDDLADTVDYGALAVTLAGVVRGEPVNLLEALADRLAGACLDDPRVAAVDVAVHKPQAPITEEFADVVLAVRRTRAERRPRRQPVRAVLALGSNLGDRLAALRAAVSDLAGMAGIALRGTSPVVETAPVGGPEQGDYLNAVLTLDTTLAPLELLAACQAIEDRQGRRRDVRWGARTLDVDVITYGDQVIDDDPHLVLPHPRAAQRAFVLAPWLALDPAATLATAGGVLAVADLLAEAPDAAGVRSRPDLTLDVPEAAGSSPTSEASG